MYKVIKRDGGQLWELEIPNSTSVSVSSVALETSKSSRSCSPFLECYEGSRNDLKNHPHLEPTVSCAVLTCRCDRGGVQMGSVRRCGRADCHLKGSYGFNPWAITTVMF